MKVRIAAFALLLILLGIHFTEGHEGEATVTKDEVILTGQNTKLFLNLPKKKENKEYLNAYFTYNENCLYVDGTDAISMNTLSEEDAYISLSFQTSGSHVAGTKVEDLGSVSLTLSDDPIYWNLYNGEGAYDITSEELTDSEYIKNLLPQTLEYFKGYAYFGGYEDNEVTTKIDLVPMKGDNVEVPSQTKTIYASQLMHNVKLYQFIENSKEETSTLAITANYNMKIDLPVTMFQEAKGSDKSHDTNEQITEKDSDASMLRVEGKLTIIQTYEIKK